MQPEPQITPRSKKSYDGNLAESIRELLRQNPNFTTKYICKKLHLAYEKHGQYVRNQKSLFRRNKCNKLQHETHRNVYVWILPELNEFKEKICVNPKHYGWNYHSRNRLLTFHKNQFGSILWHNTNRIELFLKGKPMPSRAKTLFCRAFFSDNLISDLHKVEELFNLGKTRSKHHTFSIGEKIPRFHIDYFGNSHGLTILSDNSHKDSVEIVETQPFWLHTLLSISDDFRADMAKHMQLLDRMNRITVQLNNRVGIGWFKRIKKILRSWRLSLSR